MTTQGVLSDEQWERVEAAKHARGILGRGAQTTNAGQVAELASFIIGGGHELTLDAFPDATIDPGDGSSIQGWHAELATYKPVGDDADVEITANGDDRRWWHRFADSFPLIDWLVALVVAVLWGLYLAELIDFQLVVVIMLGLLAVNVAACRTRRERRWW